MRALTTSLLAASASLTYAAPLNRHLRSFTSLVIFGDSYTDLGIHSYIPFPNGTLPNEVGNIAQTLSPQTLCGVHGDKGWIQFEHGAD